MRFLAKVAGALLAVSSLGPAAQAGGREEVHKCDFEVRARCASGDVAVTLVDGVVKEVEINDFWCGRPGNLGYSCVLDWSRDDKESRWSQDGGATTIEKTDSAGLPDRMKVTVGRYISIDLAETRSVNACGAGAELPQAIVIPASGKKCRVWLGR